MDRITVSAPQTGGVDSLILQESSLPDLPEGTIRVHPHYVGVNFWDVMQRRGDVPLPPDGVPGVEGLGTVIEVGDGADAGLLGQRVAWSRVPSSYATVVQGPETSFIVVPDNIDDLVGAAALMQGVTAQYLAESTTSLGMGQTAVVTAAAGGVGGLLTQFLRARGVEVIAVVGSAAKQEAASRNGTRAVLVDSETLVDEVKSLVPEGVDAVFDANGGDTSRLLHMLKARGICVLYGSAAAPIGAIEPGALAAGSYFLTRTAGRDYTSAPGEWAMRAGDVLARVAAGTLKPHVDLVLPLDQAAQAHRLLETRATTGKVLLDCGPVTPTG